MDIKKKIKNLFRRNKNVENKTEIPKSWAKESMKPHTSKEIRFKSHKIHVSMLRPLKRIIAGFLLVINFIISQLTLMSNPATQWMSILFFLNTFILLDYVWKTRRREA